MGASIQDINLAVIAGGRTAHYCGVKGCGNVIWDLRFGLFSAQPPDPARALDWIGQSIWEGAILHIEAPLGETIYGSTKIDFDTKAITENNGYGTADKMYFDWLGESAYQAIHGAPIQEMMIPGESLLDHLVHGRIACTKSFGPERSKKMPFQASTLAEARALWETLSSSTPNPPTMAFLNLPKGWTLVRSES